MIFSETAHLRIRGYQDSELDTLVQLFNWRPQCTTRRSRDVRAEERDAAEELSTGGGQEVLDVLRAGDQGSGARHGWLRRTDGAGPYEEPQRQLRNWSRGGTPGKGIWDVV
jgi:hypothetical protein